MAHRRQRGLSLIELVIFIAIIGIALAGILQVMNLTTAHSGDPMRRKQALAIAEALLEEVRLSRFTFCEPTDPAADQPATTSPAMCAQAEAFGPELAAGNARPFDNINDYVSAPDVEEPAFDAGGALADATLTPIPVPGYTATLRVTPEALAGLDAAEVLRIAVTVRFDNESVVLETYRTRYAPNSVP